MDVLLLSIVALYSHYCLNQNVASLIFSMSYIVRYNNSWVLIINTKSFYYEDDKCTLYNVHV